MRLIIPYLLLIAMFSWHASAQNATIKVGSSTRSMIMYVPAGTANPALILQLHGMNQDATFQKNSAKWEPIADREKFIVVFPEGNNKSWDISGDNDINFLKTIIDTMYSRYKIDRSRVYVSGFSMGGMMSYHAANKMADKIAAIAPCSGYLFGNTVNSSRPMPIIHIHGDADDVVNYSGVAATIERWREHNGCSSTAQTTSPYPASKPNSVSTKKYWGEGKENSAIALITNKGKGHWYSVDAASSNSSEEIWAFCKTYSLATTGINTVAQRSTVNTTATLVYNRGFLQVQLTNAPETGTLRLFRLNGKIAQTSSLAKRRAVQCVNIANLAKGTYILSLTNKRGTPFTPPLRFVK